MLLKFSDKEYIKTLSNFIDNVPKREPNFYIKIPSGIIILLLNNILD